MDFHGLGEKTDAIHLGHTLIGEKKGDGIVAGLELAKGRKSGAARIGAHDAITVGIMAAKIALDGSKDLGVVIDSE
jgi:hypothetical protein